MRWNQSSVAVFLFWPDRTFRSISSPINTAIEKGIVLYDTLTLVYSINQRAPWFLNWHHCLSALFLKFILFLIQQEQLLLWLVLCSLLLGTRKLLCFYPYIHQHHSHNKIQDGIVLLHCPVLMLFYTNIPHRSNSAVHHCLFRNKFQGRKNSPILDSLYYPEYSERLDLKRKEIERDYKGDGKVLRVTRALASWSKFRSIGWRYVLPAVVKSITTGRKDSYVQ